MLVGKSDSKRGTNSSVPVYLQKRSEAPAVTSLLCPDSLEILDQQGKLFLLQNGTCVLSA